MARIGNQESYYLNLLNVLSESEWIPQFQVPNSKGTYYYIDFYNEALRIGVEFEESHHRSRKQQQADIVRHCELESTLECKIYRYPQTCGLPFWDFAINIINRL